MIRGKGERSKETHEFNWSRNQKTILENKKMSQIVSKEAVKEEPHNNSKPKETRASKSCIIWRKKNSKNKTQTYSFHKTQIRRPINQRITIQINHNWIEEQLPGQWFASKAVTVKAPSGSSMTTDCPASIRTNNESSSCTNQDNYGFFFKKKKEIRKRAQYHVCKNEKNCQKKDKPGDSVGGQGFWWEGWSR